MRGRADQPSLEQDGARASAGIGRTGPRPTRIRAVHLRRAGDHVLHIIGMAGAVDMGVGRFISRELRHARGDGEDSSGRIRSVPWAGRGARSSLIRYHVAPQPRSAETLRGRRVSAIVLAAMVDVADGAHTAMGAFNRTWCTPFGRLPYLWWSHTALSLGGYGSGHHASRRSAGIQLLRPWAGSSSV